jgi:acetylornithine deacetylase/succinyl-diaminopimelate desuccinylase-like protein
LLCGACLSNCRRQKKKKTKKKKEKKKAKNREYMSSLTPIPPSPLAGERDDLTVEFFKKLLRIPSTSHEGPTSGTYTACVNLLKAEAEARGMTTRVVEPVAGRPILVATVEGTDPSLPSVLLNSHYDVVPVMREHWTMADPWAAEEVDGEILGRGTQDMKCVVIQVSFT